MSEKPFPKPFKATVVYHIDPSMLVFRADEVEAYMKALRLKIQELKDSPLKDSPNTTSYPDAEEFNLGWDEAIDEVLGLLPKEEAQNTPYYFIRPVNQGIIDLAAKWHIPIPEVVKKIVKERLIAEGVLTPKEKCLHLATYWSGAKRQNYTLICSECGLEFNGETAEFAESKWKQAKNMKEETSRLCTDSAGSHDWDPESYKCRRCGVTLDQLMGGGGEREGGGEVKE